MATKRNFPQYHPSVGDKIIAIEYPEYGTGTVLEVYESGAFIALIEWDNAPAAKITRQTKIELALGISDEPQATETSKPEIGTIVTFTSGFGSETGRVVGYATLDPDTLQVESNGDIFAKHYSDVTVAVETPAAQDSELSPKAQQVLAHWQAQYTETSRGLKTWQLANGEWVNESDIDELVAAGLVDSTPRTSLLGPLQVLNAKGLAYVVTPTSATIAITDDSAVDNTPSEQKREIEQPETLQYLTVNQAGEPVWKSVDDLPAGYEWRGGLITGHIVNTGIIEGTVKSGWLSDALATVNVEREAAANDEYLPPTADDNDDLPFSDLGEDDTTSNENQYDSLLATLVKFAVNGKVASQRKLALAFIISNQTQWNAMEIEREVEELESEPDLFFGLGDGALDDAYSVLLDIHTANKKGALV